VNRAPFAVLPSATVDTQQILYSSPLLPKLITDVQPRIVVNIGTHIPRSPRLTTAWNLTAHIQRVLCWFHPTIIQRYLDCDCNTDSYERGVGYCGEPIFETRTGRILQIHYYKFSGTLEKLNAYITIFCDNDKASEEEGYALSADTYDPNSISDNSYYMDSATTQGRWMTWGRPKIHCIANDFQFQLSTVESPYIPEYYAWNGQLLVMS
jgi:hypothetical protein